MKKHFLLLVCLFFICNQVISIEIEAAKKLYNTFITSFYFDNSSNNNVWRTLDLSNRIGKKVCCVTMYIKFTSTEEFNKVYDSVNVKFRSPDTKIETKGIGEKYDSDIVNAVEVITDNRGCIEWKCTNAGWKNNSVAVYFYLFASDK